MRKILSLITALVLCTTMWGAEVIPAGEYAGTWYRHSISQLDGRATNATSVVVSAEEDGKQTITFKGFKCGYQGDVAVDIPITVTTSNGSCTIANDVEVGHTNATYGKMYIRTYSNYTSSVNPNSMIITLCTRYYYYDTAGDGKTEKNYGTEYEYIQLNPADWTDWVAFPAADKNTATWTFSASNAFKSLIDASCDVTLMSRTAKENANHRQYKVCGFQMKSGSGKKVDLVFDENPTTKNLTFPYAGLGFSETTAKQARAKMETGSFDAEKGIFTLNVKYVYANAWKAAVAETLAIHKEEPVEKKALYLKAGSVDYMKDNAVVYAYCWGGADEDEWSKFEYVEKETTAVTSIAEDRTGMKIVRFASGTTTPSWQGTIWNQTGDISVSSDFPEKVDMIELSAWDGATAATWSKYGAAVEKPKHDYTITAYLPQFCDAIAAYADSARVMGGFDDWSNGIWMEKKIDEDFNEYWYAEIYDVEEGTAFKLRFGTDADWKVQVQLNGANMANEAFGETTDIVLHYDGEGYGFAACAAPVARKEFVFVAGEAAEANPAMFAITWGKDGSNETVKMTQKGEEALYTANILETVDSVVLVRCASDATEIIWDGEGKNVWNQTANYELCDTMYFESWVEETNLFAIKCEAPKPVETKYYAKNNWNNGDWAWLEMTKVEDLYVLDSVVFGGTGVNINTKEEDADAKWFDLKKMKYNEQDTIQALDTVRFELAISEKDTVLTAILLGRPHVPVITYKDSVYYVAGNFTKWAAEMKKLPASVELPADSALEFKEVLLRTVLADGDSVRQDTIWYGQANEGNKMTRESSAWTLDGGYNVLAKTDIAGTYTFSLNEKGEFVLGWPEKPIEETKYYVTGNAALVGEEKAWQPDAIEMVDYTYTFPMLAAGEYQLKVTDGTWEHAWGYDNLSPTVAVEGLYTDVDGNICFTVYTPNDVTVTFAQGYVVVTGDFTDPTPATPDYGLLVNGTDYLPGEASDKDTYTEYAVSTTLAIGDFVQLYDNVAKAAWTVTPEGAGFTNFDIHDNAYYIKQAGAYQFYIKIPKQGMESGLYVGFQEATGLNTLKGQSGQRFNILGQPVGASYRGFVIMNGQTFLQK